MRFTFALWPTETLRYAREAQDLPRLCTSWYGHSYRETKSGTHIFCPTCGHSRPLRTAPERQPE